MSKDKIEPENQMALFGLPEKPKTAPAEAKITKSQKSKPDLPQLQPSKSAKKTAPKNVVVAAPPPQRGRSGLVPEGDVRLTANIREDLHLRLKIAAAKKRTTIGEIIEDLVDKHVE